MSSLANRSHLTAIARSRPSAPMAFLNKDHRLVGRTLDYGCGRGVDVDAFGMDGYDPHYSPKRPEGLYDTIVCNYVLNVVTRNEQEQILRDIRGLLADNGIAYVTVRRDITKNYRTKNSVQRVVRLPYPVIRETLGYCIYYVTKYEDGMFTP